MAARLGRPPTGDAPRLKQYRIRMSQQEMTTLEYCAKGLGLSKAEIIRQGIAHMYTKAQRLAKKKGE